jgi:hypothetical protein
MYKFTRRAFMRFLGAFIALFGTGFSWIACSRSGDSDARTLDEMEKQIVALEKEAKLARDIQEIRELHYRYVNGTFFGIWDEVTDCFAEKSVFGDGELISKEEVGERLKAMGEEGSIDRQGGFTVHPTIEVNGDKASSRWLLYMLMSYHLTQQLMFYLQRIYNVEYVRENGRWKIYDMKLTQRQGPEPALNKDGKPEGPLYPGT